MKLQAPVVAVVSILVGSAFLPGCHPDAGLFLIEVRPTGSGSGIVHSIPEGIDCGHDCVFTFEQSDVRLIAEPAPGSIFVGWGGPCTNGDGQPECHLSLDDHLTITPEFSAASPRLEVELSGGGEGRVTSEPAGIDCGVACEAEYPGYSTITLTAAASGYSTFSRWIGPCQTAEELGRTPALTECVVTLKQDTLIIAEFAAPVQHTVQASTSTEHGYGSGRVVSSPAGIDCGEICSAQLSSARARRSRSPRSPVSTPSFCDGAGRARDRARTAY